MCENIQWVNLGFEMLPVGQTTVPNDNHIVVTNVRLPYVDKERATNLWTVECLGARVCKILPTSDHSLEARESEAHIDAKGGLMLPS